MKTITEKSEEWQVQQAEIQSQVRARTVAARAQQRTDEGWFTVPVSGDATTSGTTRKPNRSSTSKAAASKTNRGAVERMDRLAKQRPDLAEKVKDGVLPGAAATREMRRDEEAKKLQDIAAQEATKPTG